MKRLALWLVLLTVLGSPALAQKTVFVSPDVPTDDPGGSGTIFLPWDVVAYKGGLYSPLPVLVLPPNTAVDAIHKMDKPGNWLFSVEATTELPPGGGVYYDPEDVVRWDGLVYTMYFDGSANGVPPGSNVDAVFLLRDDFGDLVISFDVPTTIGAATFEPADTVRFAGGAYATFFDASAAGAGVAISSNVVGADEAPGLDIFAVDVPSDLLPTIGPTTYVRGEIAAWDTPNATYLRHETLAAWPAASRVDAFSCQANPGRVYERTVYQMPITLGKSLTTPGNIDISWFPSCSAGAEDYGIYEGTLGVWYSHRKKFAVCTDTGGDFTESVTPAAGDTYYLVVPHNYADEGAYGKDYVWNRIPVELERPQPAALADRCEPTKIVTPCP